MPVDVVSAPEAALPVKDGVRAGAVVMASCPRGFAAGSACAHLDRWFTTDDLGGTLSTVFISVVGFYFGQAAIKEIASMIRTRK